MCDVSWRGAAGQARPAHAAIRPQRRRLRTRGTTRRVRQEPAAHQSRHAANAPGNVKLTDAEIDRIRIWIDKGLAPEAPVTVSEHEVRAIFQVRCVLCHGSTDRKGGLDMRTLASRLKGGKSGPGLVPGKPEESLIYQRIVKGQMPPDKLAKDLAVELPTASETEKIRAWIAAGAPGPVAVVLPPDATVKDADRQFWSFQPPRRPAVPAVKNQALVRNPIDAFLLEKLEAKGLRYARAGRPPRAPAPRLPRRHRHPAVARRNRRLPPRPIARRLRKTGGPPARLAPLWRALGAALARPRRLLRFRRLRPGRWRPPLRLALS